MRWSGHVLSAAKRIGKTDCLIAKEKLSRSEMNLVDLVAYLNNVSGACRVIGYSRDTSIG